MSENKFDPSKLNIDFSKIDELIENQKEEKEEKKENIEDTNKEENKKEEVRNTNGIIEKDWKDDETKNEEKNTDNILSTFLIDETKEEKIKQEETKKEKIIIDINIKTIDDILYQILKNNYDFVSIDPKEDHAKINYKKDSKTQEIKNINLITYFNILTQAKKIAKIDEVKIWEEKKRDWDYMYNNKALNIIIKIVSNTNWETLFLKVNHSKTWINKQKTKKEAISIWTIFSFLLWLVFIWLILWWAFLSFIVLNANTPSDVAFFTQLWINLNDINSFLLKATSIIFSIIILIETIIIIIAWLKALLTKKEYKKRKTTWSILSIFMIIILFSTWSLWLNLDKTIKSLPNWQELSYWPVWIYDNTILTSTIFEKNNAFITDFSQIIWPIEIKFDANILKASEEKKWFIISKYIWDFGNWEIRETLVPETTYIFSQKWNYNLKLKVEWIDNRFPDKKTEKEVSGMPNIRILYIVKKEEKTLPNWWKTVFFDASDLKSKWQIEWYTSKDPSKPIHIWYTFQPRNIFYDEDIIWMKIKNESNNYMDKIFVISWENSNIKWKINFEVSPDNDLEYSFIVKDIETNFWDWFIDNFLRNIEWKETKIIRDPLKIEESSKIKHIFKNYWEQNIYVTLTTSTWKKETINLVLNVPKKLNLTWTLDFSLDYLWKTENITDIKYNDKTNEYFISQVPIPSELKIDSKNIKTDNHLYKLKEVSFDLNNDSIYETKEKIWTIKLEEEKDYNINVKYTFEHRINKEDIIEIKQNIFVEASIPEAQIILEINTESNYVPTIVSFDASKSKVKDDNILKFIYDYWDWSEPEERWAINPWRKYKKEWTYKIKVTAFTEKWNSYSTTKMLTLLRPPNKVKINASLKKAPIWQKINFNSTESVWQIVWYLWDFGDWNISTEPNPNHSYDSPWKYKVKLTRDFANKNVESDEIEIEIYE